MKRVAYQGHELCQWSVGPSTFTALPERGARLINWSLRMADGSVRDVIHWPEDADFDTIGKVRGGNPVLFPFAGRSHVAGRENRWRDGRGPELPMPRHGFARDGRFSLTQSGEAGFLATLEPTAEDAKAYPYDYAFSVRYSFTEVSMRVYLQLLNQGDTPLPWCAGHHFYFALPWHRGLSRADYRFRVAAKKAFRHAGDGSLLPVKPVPSDGDFSDPGINDCILTRLTDGAIRFGPAGGEEDVAVRFLDDSDTRSQWNAMVLWSESETSPYYCVEPWMGPPGAAAHGKGLHTVQPGELAVFGVEVALV